MERSLWTDERIDDRMDRIDERFDRVDARFDRVDEQLREIRTELAAINARMFNGSIAMVAAMLTIFVTLLIQTA